MKNKKLIYLIIIVIIGLVFLIIFKDSILKIMYQTKYKEIVSIYSQDYKVEENLIYALIKAESNFNKNVISNKNAIGLMQIMENTAKEIAKKNKIDIDTNQMKQELCNPYKNINIGTAYLAELLKKYGNKELALAAYNAGIGVVDNWIDKGILKKDGTNIEYIPYKETNNYVRKILRDYEIYRQLYK